jgi:leader peptidase (prepilin peptidase)/N-methyltransferase
MATAILAGALAAMLAVVTVTDVRTRLIPDLALAPAALIALVVIGASQPQLLPERLAAAAAAGGFLLAAALARPGGMGLGDVKLAAVLGLFLGRSVIAALVLALGLGALWGAGLIAAHGPQARRMTLPFAPFLATGAAVAVIAADNVDPWS